MTRSVLLAEDEPHIVESLEFLLGRAGFSVTVVSDGEAAVARAMADTPDVLVLDVMLPGINGFEVLRRLRAEAGTARLPVVMLTAKGQREDRETARRWGADVFIAKPFSNAELVETVSRLAASGTS
ncbi:response regulator [Limibaculum sp. FT325]|uniref:response regulator transcription factor n=1 Tax=Thermohalobaculum sediminis TaxID=2939436 RepID=UPI0020C08A00|nr:response regulator [Limibaculum sediminis]MCL5776315.1 response regulator [Limibaculum sediminis]